jgi:hypothetical protein
MRVDVKGGRTLWSVSPATVSVNETDSPELSGAFVCKTAGCVFFEKGFRPSKAVEGLLFRKSSEKCHASATIDVAHCSADEQFFEPHLVLDPPDPNSSTQQGTCQIFPRQDQG